MTTDFGELARRMQEMAEGMQAMALAQEQTQKDVATLAERQSKLENVVASQSQPAIEGAAKRTRLQLEYKAEMSEEEHGSELPSVREEKEEEAAEADASATGEEADRAEADEASLPVEEDAADGDWLFSQLMRIAEARTQSQRS